jgi:hypothetical protein
MSGYDDRNIMAHKHASAMVGENSIVSGSEVLQHRFAYSVRKPRIIDSTGGGLDDAVVGGFLTVGGDALQV